MTSRLSRLSTLGALSTVLLLGACSNKNETAAEASAAEEQASAEPAEAGGETDAGTQAQPAPASFWPVIAPLVAGTYTGKCMQPPEMKTVDAAITLGADGKVGAPGIESNLSKSTLIILNRDPVARSALMTLQVEGGGAQLQLSVVPDPESSRATLMAGERHLSCTHVGGTEALTSQPLHKRLAKLLDTGGQKMTCVQTGNLLNQHDTTVRVGGGVLTIGDQKFELDKVENESLQLTDGSNGFSYTVRVADERYLNLGYQGAGKLVSVMGVTVADKKYICTAQD